MIASSTQGEFTTRLFYFPGFPPSPTPPPSPGATASFEGKIANHRIRRKDVPRHNSLGPEAQGAAKPRNRGRFGPVAPLCGQLRKEGGAFGYFPRRIHRKSASVSQCIFSKRFFQSFVAKKRPEGEGNLRLRRLVQTRSMERQTFLPFFPPPLPHRPRLARRAGRKRAAAARETGGSPRPSPEHRRPSRNPDDPGIALNGSFSLRRNPD